MSDIICRKEYTLSLVAYLYRCYKNKDPKLSYAASDMPFPLTYSNPKKGKSYLLNAQVEVNRVLREYLQPFFEKVYLSYCSCPQVLQNHLRHTKLHDLLHERNCPADLTPMKLLACVAFITELVLYCFKNNCYRLANFLPLYLNGILESPEFDEIFTDLDKETIRSARATESLGIPFVDERTVEYVKKLPLKGYSSLKAYCKKLYETENHPSLGIFKEIGHTFRDEQTRKLDEGEGPSDEPKKRKVVAGGCAVCGLTDCQKYLQDFIDTCQKRFGECGKCKKSNCICPFLLFSRSKKGSESD